MVVVSCGLGFQEALWKTTMSYKNKYHSSQQN